eukprot:gene9028-10698_t
MLPVLVRSSLALVVPDGDDIGQRCCRRELVAGEFEVQFGDTVVSVEIVDGRVYIQWGFPPKEGPLVSPGDVVVRETGDVRGRGAYVANPIEEGTFLGDYEGELLDNAEYFKRYPSGVADYCIGVDPDYVLDGVEVAKGDEFTIAHINHS